jgi:hypothetical protein
VAPGKGAEKGSKFKVESSTKRGNLLGLGLGLGAIGREDGSGFKVKGSRKREILSGRALGIGAMA